MGKVVDFFMTGGDWEEYQRIQLYKKVGNSLDSKSQPLDKDSEIRNLKLENQKMISEIEELKRLMKQTKRIK